MTVIANGAGKTPAARTQDTDSDPEILVRSMERTNSGRETDPIRGELYLAGERVPAGLYRRIGAKREVRLREEDTLPASLDGKVACYERIEMNRIVLRYRPEEGS